MDLTLPILASLLVLGYKLNTATGTTPRIPPTQRNALSPNTLPNPALPSEAAKSTERALAQAAFAAGQNPATTGVIPAWFNPVDGMTLGASGTMDMTSVPTVTNSKAFSPREERVYSSELFQGMQTVENFANVNAPIPDTTNFNFSNKLPFFGAKITQNTTHEFGSKNVPFFHKQEISNNITPQRQLVFGTPAPDTAAMMDRMNPGLSQNNVLPFVQQRPEPPIPGYANRPSYKNVDQLRAANNPKPTGNRSRITGGANNTAQRGLLGKLRQTVAQMTNGFNRGLAGGGAVIAPALRENFTPECTMRGNGELDSNIAMGIATGGVPKSYVPVTTMLSDEDSAKFGAFVTQVDIPHKSTYKGDFMMNVKSAIPHQNLDAIQDSYCFPTQERESTAQQPWGAPGNANFGDYVAPEHPARPTLKEAHLFSYTPNPESVVPLGPSNMAYDNMEVRGHKDELNRRVADCYGPANGGSLVQLPMGSGSGAVINAQQSREKFGYGCIVSQQPAQSPDTSLMCNLQQNPYNIVINPLPSSTVCK